MQSGTLLITGPSCIQFWLYRHLAGHSSFENYLNNKGLAQHVQDHLKLAEAFKQFQGTEIATIIAKPWVQQKYGFPSKYVRIQSEGSWLR